MKKVFLSFLFLGSFNFVNADWLMTSINLVNSSTSFKCVSSYYFSPSGSSFYYTMSGTLNPVSMYIRDYQIIFSDGYDFNLSTGQCKPQQLNNTLGLKNEDFNYLNALIGILIFIMMLVCFL